MYPPFFLAQVGGAQKISKTDPEQVENHATTHATTAASAVGPVGLCGKGETQCGGRAGINLLEFVVPFLQTKSASPPFSYHP